MNKVVAVMANWNGGETAVQSALSIVGQTAAPRLVVVDNASADGSAEAIQAACPDVLMIRNQENLGYAAANNQGLRAVADADYYLLVNNDVVLPDAHGLESVVEHLEAEPSIHGACGRYEYPDGRFQNFYSNLPSPFVIASVWGVLRHVPGVLHSAPIRTYYAQNYDFDRPATLDAPAFACVLLRGECARAVGLMDERFPIFFNDADYCRRWRDRHWTWHFFPEWRVIHHQSVSVRKKPALLTAELLSSAARYAWKHFSPLTACAVHGAIVLEAAWRKFRYGDLGARLVDITMCRTFYCLPRQGKEPSGAAAVHHKEPHGT